MSDDLFIKFIEQQDKKLDSIDSRVSGIHETVIEHKIILERLTVILDEHQKRSTSLEELVQIHKDESSKSHQHLEGRIDQIEEPFKLFHGIKFWVLRIAPVLAGIVSIVGALKFFKIF